MSALVSTHSSTTELQLLPAWLAQARRVVALLALLALVAPPLYLSQTGGALATGYSIQRLQEEKRQWEMRNRQLELELAKAQSLAWVEAEAINRLGMQRPAQQLVIHVDRPVPPPAARPTPVAAANIQPTTRPADEPAQAPSWIETAANLLADVVGQ